MHPVLLALVAAAGLACRGGTGAGPAPTGDGGAALGEDPDVEAALGFTLEVAAQAPAALIARWDPGDAPGAPPREDLVVEVDPGEGEPYALPVEVARGARILVGFGAEREVAVRLVATVDGRRGATAWQGARTGVLPVDLAALQVDAAEPGALDGGVVLVAQIQNPPAILVIGAEGEPVWWRVMDDASWLSRVRRSADGERILAFDGLNMDAPATRVRSFALDGELVGEVAIEGAHHDFVELPDGTLAVLTWDPREIDGAVVLGDRILEVAPDGTRTARWSVFDSFAYDPALDSFAGEEWTHANALEHDPATDRYLVTLPGLSAIVAIGRSSPAPDWVLGGPWSDRTDTAGQTNLLGFVHGVDLLEGEAPGDGPDRGVLVFENSAADRPYSSVVELSFDPTEPLVRETWRYTPDPPLAASALGNAFRLESGHTLVDFATAGRLAEVLPDGQVVWQVSTALGDPLGYASLAQDFR